MVATRTREKGGCAMSSVSISGNNTLRNLHYTGRARLTGKRSSLVGRLEMAKAAYSVRRVDLSDVSDVIAGVRPSPGDLVLARERSRAAPDSPVRQWAKK